CCLHWGDALKFRFSELSPLPRKIIANIPYNITSDVMWKILVEAVPLGVHKVILLVQKEAAERLTAPVRTKKRGPLGVTLELMAKARPLMKVSPDSFVPPPKVWSTLLCIDIKDNRDLAAQRQWRNFIASGFAQRRKKLLNTLPTIGPSREKWEALFNALHLPLSARAEELTALQWLELYHLAQSL
ncbi:MAG: ribosomal RNA small subunit methyltransferase A, partial [Pyramidobacter sp.]